MLELKRGVGGKKIIGPALSARWSLNALARQIKNKNEGDACVDREEISAAARVLGQRQYKCCERKGEGV